MDAAGHGQRPPGSPRSRRSTSAPTRRRRLFATARDGTQVPYVVIHKKGLKLDGQHAGVDLRLRLLRRRRPTRRPSPAARSRWSMRASSSATPTCAAAASTGATGTRRGSSRTSPTPGATSSMCAWTCAPRSTPRRRGWRSAAARPAASPSGRALGRAAGPVRRRHRRRRLVQSAALRGRAERLRRGTGVGQRSARSPATGP